jgi:hypothetical protein
MTELEITERLILAAEIADQGNHVGPMRLRAQQLPYVHSQADMNGWGKKPGERDMLRREDSDAHAALRDRFFSAIPDDPRSVSEAEEAVGWYGMVENEDHRAALAGWVECMANCRRMFFKDWCHRAGISEKTGRKRKNAAVASIHAHLVRSDVQNYDIGSVEGLLEPGEIGHVDDRIGDAWRGDPYSLEQSSKVLDFDWAEKRNEHRRKMAKRKAEAEAKKRQNQAA